MQSILRKAFVNARSHEMLVNRKAHSVARSPFATRSLTTQGIAQRVLNSEHSLTHYYHLAEGEGDVFELPQIVYDHNWKRCEVASIGTTGCRYCACVYVRLGHDKCFAAHIKAAVHTEEKYDFFPTPEQGHKLRHDLLVILQNWPGLKDFHIRDHNYADQSIIVCPDMVVDGNFSTGTYIVQALQEFFGITETSGNRVHGFVVDHLHDEQKLLGRSFVKTKGVWSIEEDLPEKHGYQRCNPMATGEDVKPHEWSFVWYQGRWMRASQYLMSGMRPWAM